MSWSREIGQWQCSFCCCLFMSEPTQWNDRPLTHKHPTHKLNYNGRLKIEKIERYCSFKLTIVKMIDDTINTQNHLICMFPCFKKNHKLMFIWLRYGPFFKILFLSLNTNIFTNFPFSVERCTVIYKKNLTKCRHGNNEIRLQREPGHSFIPKYWWIL